MNAVPSDIKMQLYQLIEEYRDRCLWFLRVDYYPESLDSALRALDYIRRYGDNRAFQRAGELKRWLLRISSEQSASS